MTVETISAHLPGYYPVLLLSSKSCVFFSYKLSVGAAAGPSHTCHPVGSGQMPTVEAA